MCAPPRFCTQLWALQRYFCLFVILSGLESTTLKPIYWFWASGDQSPFVCLYMQELYSHVENLQTCADTGHVETVARHEGDGHLLPLLRPHLLPLPLRLHHRTLRRLLCVRIQTGVQDQGLWRHHPWTRGHHGQVVDQNSKISEITKSSSDSTASSWWPPSQMSTSTHSSTSQLLGRWTNFPTTYQHKLI